MNETQPVKAGDMVAFVLPADSRHPGEIRGAVVANAWNATCLNLLVFADGSNDGPDFAAGATWRTSVLEDPSGTTPGTWHRRA